jgi:hypothetical protein
MSTVTLIAFGTLIALVGPILNALPALRVAVDYARYRRHV